MHHNSIQGQVTWLDEACRQHICLLNVQRLAVQGQAALEAEYWLRALPR
jgi:hypothetical protein